MKQYFDILNNILDNGVWKSPARENMPRTLGIFSVQERFNCKEQFPILTSKKIFWRGIVIELLWFLRGDSNIKYLIDNNVHIWDENAYKYYLRYVGKLETPDYDYLVDDPSANKTREFTFDEFIDRIKNNKFGTHNYKLGDLGRVYGSQWRNWDHDKTTSSDLFTGVDQLRNLITSLTQTPDSRYHVVTAWNPSEVFETAQPNCHIMFQCYVRELSDELKQKYQKQYGLSLDMTQRSCDTFLGVPFNISSYALLLNIIARITGMHPDELIWNGKDVHIYEDHLDKVKLQLSRQFKQLPTIKINENLKTLDDFITKATFDDFKLIDYNPHPLISAKLSVGLKK